MPTLLRELPLHHHGGGGKSIGSGNVVGHPPDDGDNGKTSKPRHEGPIAKVTNRPPAASRPLSSASSCGFRRRSDLALAIIGTFIVILCVSHFAFHSGNLPRHTPTTRVTRRSTTMTPPPCVGLANCTDSGPARAARHMATGEKSALQMKLEEFVKARKRKDGSEMKFLQKKERDISQAEQQQQQQQQQQEELWQQKQHQQLNVIPDAVVVDKLPAAQSLEQQPQQIEQQQQPQPPPPQQQHEKQQQQQQQQQQHQQQHNQQQQSHPVAHLNCADHGGPTDPDIVDEMVFWSDVPSDSSYLSPMHPLRDPHTSDDVERYLSFEPDHGGWNNVRMAMETALVMSHAMGRTLVLPPKQGVYLLNGGGTLGFDDFYHLDAISVEHRGFKVISMEEFLMTVGNAGDLIDKEEEGGGETTVRYPPENRTNWDGKDRDNLWEYLRSVGNTPEWDPWECALAIPRSTDNESITELVDIHRSIMDGSFGKPKPTLEEFNGHPTAVNASIAERMREMLADREDLCIYDGSMQGSKLIHLKVVNKPKEVRLLTHFYAFIFFADWRQDLWSKRFVRDHLRYVDDIVCAAARVVEAVRDHARKNDRHNASLYEGIYDSMHVRRGDFQYTPTRLPADQLYKLSPELTEGATLYVATDEKDKDFFRIFMDHYDVVFLDDFRHVIKDVDTTYYGMIDQLVAYKSRVFYGTWWSTLSGYVNRMRGYYIAKHKLEGHLDGTMKSWYFTPEERILQMREYIPVRKPLYCREFPISWRDIDQGIDEIAST